MDVAGVGESGGHRDRTTVTTVGASGLEDAVGTLGHRSDPRSILGQRACDTWTSFPVNERTNERSIDRGGESDGRPVAR